MASKRDKIRLISRPAPAISTPRTRTRRTRPAKMEIKKYDPVVRKHVIYKEGKIK
jgi:large subunit ribosomal protein L33